MFCPNCGNNCADANFCSQCGRKLKQTIQKEGVADPHCDAQPTVDKPERQRKQYYFDISYGTYGGYRGYIILKEDALVIKNWYTEPVTVPYKKINEVYYFPAKFLDFPRITIRWEGNKERPIPVNYTDPAFDDTTIYYYHEDKSIFSLIFRALKDIAEKNKADSK